MYEAIKKYCENDRTNGLYLMDMPTGSGKTYNVIKYIFDASINEANKDRRYFFITTLKKNLPIADLEKRFKDAGKQDLFREKFLFIDSNEDCVIEHLDEELKRSIPYDIAKTDEYKEFARDVELLQHKDSDFKLKTYAASFSKNFEKTERSFRNMVQAMLAKEYPSVEKRIYAVKTDKRWKWLGVLYPAVFTRERQIIFMSVNKFLVRNTPIVEPPYMFYNSDIVNNAIIFIDEFDQTKETMLRNIVQNGLRDKIDYVDLFNTIYGALQTNAFPAVLTISSQKRKNSDYANQSLQGVIDGIREKADAIYKNFSLQFSHRTIDTADTTSHNFLFQDHQYLSILDGGKSFITTYSDSKQKINAITFSKEKPINESNNIQVLLGKLRGFISWFQGAVNILAINYMQRKFEMRKDGEDEFTFESSVRSVLSLFRLNDEYLDYMTSQILIASHKGSSGIESSEFDRSFYENGFRFYAFEDDPAHDMQSKIMMYSFRNTPEKLLLRFCEKAKVIGISATATVETVIGNYDLDYLRGRMQSAYEVMSEGDRRRLIETFEKSQSGYDGINIKTELLGELDPTSYGVASWYTVYENKEIAQHIYERLEREQPGSKDRNNYNKERYLRIALAYLRFICMDDIKSFLCVLTKHPKSGDYTLNLDAIYEIFKYIAAERWPGFDAKKSVVLLDGDEFETKKNTVMQRLENGEKIFVISVYQTIGAGQNLQYKVPAVVHDSLIQVNDRNLDEKDYDAIYLDRPTNLLVNFLPNQAVEEDDFVKALFQYEFLMEGSEISADDARKHIRNAFKHYISDGKAQREGVTNLHDSKSIRLLSTRYIIQAIGRICRTSMKNRNIYIYADRRIADSIDISVAERRALNYEFLKLVDLIKQTGYKPPAPKSLEWEASLNSSRINKDIRSMLEEEWNDKQIQKWQKLRDLTLRMPTMSAAEAASNFAALNYYVHLPAPGSQYYFCQQEDFNNVDVSFVPDNRHTRIVSAAGAKLSNLMAFQDIRKMFEQHGYATEFAANDYIMAPPLWNNIYKGAVGEVVGKFLFARMLHVQLEEIANPEIFELFDYQVKGMPVFVDFKNWHEMADFDRKKQLDKIASKAEKCGCKCVIIANILATQMWSVSTTVKNEIEIIMVPALLVEKPKPCANVEAWRKIKEVIDRYGN